MTIDDKYNLAEFQTLPTIEPPRQAPIDGSLEAFRDSANIQCYFIPMESGMTIDDKYNLAEFQTLPTIEPPCQAPIDGSLKLKPSGIQLIYNAILYQWNRVWQ